MLRALLASALFCGNSKAKHVVRSPSSASLSRPLSATWRFTYKKDSPSSPPLKCGATTSKARLVV
jgi:hypothetical protein